MYLSFIQHENSHTMLATYHDRRSKTSHWPPGFQDICASTIGCGDPTTSTPYEGDLGNAPQMGSCNGHSFSLGISFFHSPPHAYFLVHLNNGCTTPQHGTRYASLANRIVSPYCLMQFHPCLNAWFKGPHYSMFFCAFFNPQILKILIFFNLVIFLFIFGNLEVGHSLLFYLSYLLSSLLLVF
jgi:hypothetical protein